MTNIYTRTVEASTVQVLDNPTTKLVIEGKTDYNQLPYSEEDEIEKGYCLEDQADIVATHQHSEPLCEALGFQACRQKVCPLFISKDRNRHAVSLCREFKLAFED